MFYSISSHIYIMILCMHVQFEGSAGDRLCKACLVFATNQPKAEKLLREWKRKNDKLKLFIRVRYDTLIYCD